MTAETAYQVSISENGGGAVLFHSVGLIVTGGRWLPAGMVTIKFKSELPTFDGRLDSNLARFLAHDFLDGPHRRRAF